MFCLFCCLFCLFVCLLLLFCVCVFFGGVGGRGYEMKSTAWQALSRFMIELRAHHPSPLFSVSYLHTYMTYMHTHTHTHTHVTYMQTHTHAGARAHTCTHARARTHTHTHKYTVNSSTHMVTWASLYIRRPHLLRKSSMHGAFRPMLAVVRL